MSHEIKFRGLTKEGQWVYGDLVTRGIGPACFFIMTVNDVVPGVAVIPETVGQYTTLRDCKPTKEFPNGEEIYRGDILQGVNTHPMEVVWTGYGWGIRYQDHGEEYVDAIDADFFRDCQPEVIGNIHQNDGAQHTERALSHEHTRSDRLFERRH